MSTRMCRFLPLIFLPASYPCGTLGPAKKGVRLRIYVYGADWSSGARANFFSNSALTSWSSSTSGGSFFGS